VEAVYIIKSLEQLRALAHPLRIKLVEKLIEKPRTATQVAELLNESPNKLYYHLTELEQHGLVRVVKTQQKGNLIEKYYQPVAQFFRVDEGLFHRGPEGLEAFYQSIVALLDATALDLRKAIQTGQWTADDIDRIIRLYIRFRLTPEQIERFRRKLKALLDEFKALESPEAPSQVTLTLVFYPWDEPVSSTEDAAGEVEKEEG
jgi:DNA-binding transcriptional ArsR family regulator